MDVVFQSTTTAETLTGWGTLALAIATVVLAAVAVFEKQIHDWISHPTLSVSIKAEPPDCLSIPLHNVQTGAFMSDCIYLRLRVSSGDQQAAQRIEVFANKLERKDKSGNYQRVTTFLPMNFVWADIGNPFFVVLNPGIDHFCDLGRIIDPANRAGEDLNPGLELTSAQTSLRFSTLVQPTHLGNIVPPGDYRLHIVVAASNAKKINRIIEISLDGTWYPTEGKMLADGIGVSVREV